MKQLAAGQLGEWTRDFEDKKIAGVCAGISSQVNVPVTAVRAFFVLLALPTFASVGIVLYLIFWFLMPAGPGERSGLDRLVDAVCGLTSDTAPDRSGEEETSRNHAPTDYSL